ncbi:MAG: peptidoglycan DD-metalloendopeptidase family protein [Deltaproteobacteria bacterium]|nr:peptidoglycan DD-metalloendopeptidase family protein [Deltaproteobacteria bacterium]
MPSEPARPQPVVIERGIRRNDTFYTVLNEFQVPPDDIARIAKKAHAIYNLDRVKEGDVVRVTKIGGDLKRIEYRWDRLEGLYVEKDPAVEDGFRVDRFSVPSTVGETVVSGTIESSLYEAGVKAGAGPRIIMELSDIFAWDVDFTTEIRKGDTFSVIYETVYAEGEPVGIGRILGAEMSNDGQRYVAVYYKDSNGKGDYYDQEGNSLRRMFLKSPLRYRRISSYFTKRRFHPILKLYRPHHGIDYAAPAGTPVEAAGDGRVTFSGWKSGYGNFIEIKHANSSYITGYGHLQRAARGISAGRRVGQGEVIGFVGSTGISTGPHLHYEVRRGGSLVNPLSMNAGPRNKQLDKREMAAFRAVSEQVAGRLAARNTVVAKAQGDT